jgi:predicted DNA-binding protein
MYDCVIVCVHEAHSPSSLRQNQVKKLQVLSGKTGAPVAELIRRAIDKYLKERAKEIK